MNEMKRITIRDVAKVAGASITTVSRVLNKSDYPVKKELREKIIRVAEELNYKPNIFGKMLKGGSSTEIGVIVPTITNPYYAQLVSVVEKECILRGYVPIICSSYNSSKLERKHLDMLIQKKVAGIIISTINSNEAFLSELIQNNIRFILFDQNYEGTDYDNVSFDFLKSGYMATEYTIKCGHRSIAMLTTPLDRRSRKLIYEGYRKALKDNGIHFDKKWLIVLPAGDNKTGGDSDYENGKKLAKSLLNVGYLPDAVIAINDMTAIGIINELSVRGIRVPDDISVIGFDNILISFMVSPALTTIEQPTYETGYLATKILLDRIEGIEVKNSNILLQPSLIVRETVKRKNV